MKKKIKNQGKRAKKSGKLKKGEEGKLLKAIAELDEHSKPEKKSRPTPVDYKKFVEVWSGAKTLDEVARALNIKNGSASAIANRLRENKVVLKRFPRRGAQEIDVKLLNRIAAAAGKAR